MKRIVAQTLFGVVAVSLLASTCVADATRAGFSTTYPRSYEQWQNAFLAGNGKMGIMVFGNPLDETVIYNDRGFNFAKSSDRSFAQVSPADIAHIKELCAEGNFKAANDLAVSSAHYQGGGEGNRHPGYEMLIHIAPDGPVSNYLRTCDFRTGEILVQWTDARGNWERKAFVSRKDNVIVQYLSAPSGGKLACSIQLTTDERMKLSLGGGPITFTNVSNAGFLDIRAKYPPSATGDAGYEGVTRVIVNGGTNTLDGNLFQVADADSVLLLTRTAKYPEDCETNWDRQLIQQQLAILPADYQTLLRGQIETHGAIYDRVKIDLGASAADRAKTNEQLLEIQKASPQPVKALWERIFDAGRYYYLSSSSDLTPPDLLGIWTGDGNAGWGGFYHLDANLNLQISGGNIGDMPEAMAGYFNLIEGWRPDFETNARKLLGTRGMVAAGNSPGPSSGLISGISTFYPYAYATGEADWLLYPFWEHYLITGDKDFLRHRLFPLLQDMGYFYEDFLKLRDSNGKLIFAGSVSPENQPSNLKVSLLNNSTFDISVGRFALTALIQTCKELGVEQGPGQGVERWTALLKDFPDYRINPDGAMAEWSWFGLEDAYGHRHSSQLLTVWPYRAITPEGTPDLFAAASITQQKKDKFNYGTGHGWLHAALIAAGLKNGDSVNSKILQLMRNGFYFDSLSTSHNANHDVFCTDVCNTMPTIMMEMLLSSDQNVVELLPALPPQLSSGSISGLKARTQLTVEKLTWDTSAHSVTCVLRSDVDQNITLIERSGIESIATDAGVKPSPFGLIARVISLKAGVKTPVSVGVGTLRDKAVNAALDHPVVVSSVADDSPGVNAVDADSTSRWSSEHSDNQRIYVDQARQTSSRSTNGD